MMICYNRRCRRISQIKDMLANKAFTNDQTLMESLKQELKELTQTASPTKSS